MTMGMRSEISINWGEKEYKLLVTMDVICRIEDQFNIAKFNLRCATGDIRYSHAAKLISLVLNEAGAETTPDFVYDAILNGGEVEQEDLIPILSTIFEAVFPPPEKKLNPTETISKES